jgi:hypothetical protein
MANYREESFRSIGGGQEILPPDFWLRNNVISHHNLLACLTAPKSAKLLQWSLALQNFNLHFHYKPVKRLRWQRLIVCPG